MARYWYEGSPQGWNRIGRIIAAKRGLDRWEHARLLGLLNAVVAEDLPGPGTVFLSVAWDFRAPVRPGDTITGEVEVTSVREDRVGTPGGGLGFDSPVEVPSCFIRLAFPHEGTTQGQQGSQVVWIEGQHFFPVIPSVHPVVHL